MADPYQSSHLTEAVDELLSQFRQRANILGYVTGLMVPMQALEDNALLLRTERLLSTAVGAQLDRYGDLVGEPRGSLADADYRRFVQARILANLNGGNGDRMIEVFRLIAGPKTTGTAVAYAQVGVGPAYSLTILRDAPLATDVASRVADTMDAIRPAGVGHRLVEADGALAFQFDVGPGFDLGELSALI